MPRASSPSRPVSQTDSVVTLERMKRDAVPSSVPLESGQFAEEPVRARYEREAEELRHYWRHLIGELRLVDHRLEELRRLLS